MIHWLITLHELWGWVIVLILLGGIPITIHCRR